MPMHIQRKLIFYMDATDVEPGLGSCFLFVVKYLLSYLPPCIIIIAQIASPHFSAQFILIAALHNTLLQFLYLFERS